LYFSHLTEVSHVFSVKCYVTYKNETSKSVSHKYSDSVSVENNVREQLRTEFKKIAKYRVEMLIGSPPYYLFFLGKMSDLINTYVNDIFIIVINAVVFF
jgi:hypothetical protein